MWSGANDKRELTAWNKVCDVPTARAGGTGNKNIFLFVLDELGEGGISISRGGYVTELNSRAHQLMGRDLVLTGGKLRIVGCPKADVKLRTLIAQIHEPTRAAAAPWVVVPRESQQPLFIRPVHVPSQTEDVTAILRLSDLEETPALDGTLAAELFGLTPAELKVAEMLAWGKDAAKIAALNGRTVGTVRCQIKAVFAKTRTRRQSELASLMVRIAERTSRLGARVRASEGKCLL